MYVKFYIIYLLAHAQMNKVREAYAQCPMDQGCKRHNIFKGLLVEAVLLEIDRVFWVEINLFYYGCVDAYNIYFTFLTIDIKRACQSYRILIN